MATRWLGTGCDQLGPVDMPVIRPHQLTIEDAIGLGFEFGTPANRKASLQPAIDIGAGAADEFCNSTLSASREYRALNRCSFGDHVDIVQNESAKSTQNNADPVIKLGMEVWKHIENELHRRRKNAAWLAEKIDSSRQVISGWKRRGVPTARYEQIAALFGWSVDRLITGVDDVQTSAVVANVHSPTSPESLASIYSPMALDVARMIDAIPDEQQKRRAYALILQLLAMDAAPSPTVPVQAPAGPAGSPTPTPFRGR